MKRYEGSRFFRQRIVCSLLSGIPIRIDNIRDSKQHVTDGPYFGVEQRNTAVVGLQEYELSLLKLIDKITKGTVIDMDKRRRTWLIFKPGVILGGSFLVHECSIQRGIGYYLEVLVSLAPFAKKDTSIRLRGVTNHPKDVSVDMFRNCTLFWMKKFGFEESEPTIQIMKRGSFPKGGGEIQFTCPIIKNQLKPVQIMDEGMIKRIRGIAYSTRVAESLGPRMVSSAREVLNHYIPDVWIFLDHYKGPQSGLSPGYAIYLQAETDTNCRICVEYNGEKGIVPEDLGKHTAYLLLEEIKKGGCVDTNNQWLLILFMALASEDVSKIRLGQLTEYTIQYLRHIRDFFGSIFKVTPDFKSNTVILSCVGTGFRNLSRKSS